MSDLLAVRKLVIELSGRADLVVNLTGYADNGADKYIRAAQAWLDGRLNVANAEVELVVQVEAGDFSFDLSNVRAVREVTVHHATNGMLQMTRKTLLELYDMLKEDQDDFSDLEKGFPTFFTVVGKRDVTTPTEETETEKRVLFVSPADDDYEMRVQALVGSAELTDDESVSYWTAKHPMVLAWATMWVLETSYRNTEGAADWFASIQSFIDGFEADAAEEQVRDLEGRYAWGTT